MSVSIKKLKKEDINLCVKLHKQSYPNYLFTSRFSDKLLAKFYSKLIDYCEYNYAICWNETYVGLIIAGKSSANARNSFIKENLISLMVVLLKNPKFFIKKTFSIFSKSYASIYKLRLLNILVSPKYQSKPITLNAIRLFENKLENNNEEIYGLSVRSNNLKAINFYIKNGSRIETIQNGSVYFFKHV
tara:strand:- start:1437 stop:2000 length:564 start_codon:yes stop_codon:yes gene_type:complete